MLRSDLRIVEKGAAPSWRGYSSMSMGAIVGVFVRIPIARPQPPYLVSRRPLGIELCHALPAADCVLMIVAHHDVNLGQHAKHLESFGCVADTEALGRRLVEHEGKGLPLAMDRGKRRRDASEIGRRWATRIKHRSDTPITAFFPRSPPTLRRNDNGGTAAKAAGLGLVHEAGADAGRAG